MRRDSEKLGERERKQIRIDLRVRFALQKRLFTGTI